jgi:hypothetical protein
MQAAGEKPPGPSMQQRAEQPGGHPKSAEEIAQTRRDHGE